MLIESGDFKKELEQFYSRYIPCGEPTPYEQGFMDALKYAIKAVDFIPEADQPKQLAFDMFLTDDKKHGTWAATPYEDANGAPLYRCSECGNMTEGGEDYGHKYCPYCGAEMEMH